MTFNIKKIYLYILLVMVSIIPLITLDPKELWLCHRYARIFVLPATIIGLLFLTRTELKENFAKAKVLTSPVLLWFCAIVFGALLNVSTARLGIEALFFSCLLGFLCVLALGSYKFSPNVLFSILAITNIFYSLWFLYALANKIWIHSLFNVNCLTFTGGAVLVTVVLFARFYEIKNKFSLPALFCLAGFLCGVLNIILIRERTGLFGLGAIFFLPFFRKEARNWKIIVPLLLAFLIPVIFFWPTGRIQQGFQNIIDYATNGQAHSSIGIRFELWKAALFGAISQPFNGWGVWPLDEILLHTNYQTPLSDFWYLSTHFHNDFMHALARFGLPGAIGLGASLLYMLHLAKENLSCQLLVVTVAMAGCFEIYLTGNARVISVFYILWFLLALVSEEKEQCSATRN